MPRRSLNVSPWKWLLVSLASGLVITYKLLVPGPSSPPVVPQAPYVPPPVALPLSEGGVGVLVPGRDAPLRLTLEGTPWELTEVRYSRHDDLPPQMLEHVEKLRGWNRGYERVALPRSLPHVRVSVKLHPLAPLDGAANWRDRLLLRDHKGEWHPPVYSGNDLGFPLPPEVEPVALGLRGGHPNHCVNLYYRGVTYGPGFSRGSGAIYVQTDAAGNDVAYMAGFGGGNSPTLANPDNRFLLDGVDMRRWTQQHAKDRGFGEAKELISFERRPKPD